MNPIEEEEFVPEPEPTPYELLKASPEFSYVQEKLGELRLTYIGVDENIFRRADNAKTCLDLL